MFELIRLGATRDRLTVVPCGVDLDRFTPEGPREPRTPGRGRLVAVGRLVPRKGLGNVIEALAALPGTELVIAGGPPRDELRDDPEAARLRRIAEDHGVADRVELRGRVGAGRPPGAAALGRRRRVRARGTSRSGSSRSRRWRAACP